MEREVLIYDETGLNVLALFNATQQSWVPFWQIPITNLIRGSQMKQSLPEI
jgi:hypothetical protein